MQKAELEKRLFPLWLVNYAAAKIKPGLEEYDNPEYLAKVLSDSPAPQPKTENKRTPDDIMPN